MLEVPGVDDSAVSLTSPTIRDVAPWVERLARVGYLAKALLYITIGMVAAGAAFGPGRTTDTQGALRLVHDMTFGRVILLVMAGGLIGYAVWRVVEAVVDPDGRGLGAKGVALRAGSAGRGLLHGALAVTALRLAYGDRSATSRDQAREWTSTAFDLPGGALLVWIAAASVAGYGVYQLYRSYAPKLGRQLDLSQLREPARGWVIGMSRFGIAARGVVFCLIGFFLARAASRHDAGQVGGIRESLGIVAGLGRWPFVVVALGLVAYGLYELVNARYRRIRAS
ncbi:MAG TPA: DUF1206 domain-containing protein [Gemmatimonadales bacterium]|nr:DUF1206 domain-containing protein [Gemmatimonadales bacterium]